MSTYSIAKYVASIAAALLLGSVVQSVGCNPTLQSEGARCNPTLASGEGDCNSGLTCTQPSLCPENYCCPVDSKGNPATSSNPFCQTGCGGGAASICNANANNAAQCAFACQNDPSDLTNPSICGSLTDGGSEGGSDDGGSGDGGGPDGSSDTGPVDSGKADVASGTGPADTGGPDVSSDANDSGVADGGTD